MMLSYVFKVKNENIVSKLNPETAGGYVQEEPNRIFPARQRSQILLSVVILVLTLGIWYIFV